MPDEQDRQQVEIERSLSRQLEKAETRAMLWKWVAIITFCMALFCILELRGCFPSWQGWDETP
jgi:hypothetical protein